MFKVKGPEPHADIEVFLSQERDGVAIRATGRGSSNIIAELKDDGLRLYPRILPSAGIPVDGEGKIKLVT